MISYSTTKETADKSPEIIRIQEYLKQDFKRYPYDDTKDSIFLDLVVKYFSNVDILEELKNFHIWTLDVEPTINSYRSVFRNWLTRADTEKKS